MLSSLVIGLREGLEAALIVGIVAAFLRAHGRLDLLRWVWIGVGAAVVLCLGVGIALKVASENLPRRQQEGLETVIALVAVVMVTYMVLWMRRHSRTLKHDLEGAAGVALATGSGWALVAMAFLAVFREGFETAVFLLAAFNESDNPASSATGALIGILAACGLGYGIYTGGFRINLARFFRITGAVLVLVAAGLVVSALHTAHEAGWLNAGQHRVADLTWLVRPGSVQSSLLTGMLGWQPRPVVIEVVAYLAYLVPVMVFVLWPAGRAFPRRALTVASAVALGVAAVSAGALVIARPDRPAAPTTAAIATDAGTLDVTVVERAGDAVTFRVGGAGEATAEYVAAAAGEDDIAGRAADVYRTAPVVVGEAETQQLTLDELAALNGGRLPLGVNADTDPGGVTVHTSREQTATLWLDAATAVPLDVDVTTTARSVADLSVGSLPLGSFEPTVVAANDAGRAAQARAAGEHAAAAERADEANTWLLIAAAVAVLALAGLVTLLLAGRSARIERPPTTPRPTSPRESAADRRHAAPAAH